MPIINVVALLNPPTAGGVWSVIQDPSSGGVPFGDYTSIDFTNAPPGAYIFRYTVTSSCGVDTADVTINILETPVPDINISGITLVGNSPTQYTRLCHKCGDYYEYQVGGETGPYTELVLTATVTNASGGAYGWTPSGEPAQSAPDDIEYEWESPQGTPIQTGVGSPNDSYTWTIVPASGSVAEQTYFYLRTSYPSALATTLGEDCGEDDEISVWVAPEICAGTGADESLCFGDSTIYDITSLFSGGITPSGSIVQYFYSTVSDTGPWNYLATNPIAYDVSLLASPPTTIYFEKRVSKFFSLSVPYSGYTCTDIAVASLSLYDQVVISLSYDGCNENPTGNPYTITANTLANPQGYTLNYQWYFNGTPVGTNQDSYIVNLDAPSSQTIGVDVTIDGSTCTVYEELVLNISDPPNPGSPLASYTQECDRVIDLHDYLVGEDGGGSWTYQILPSGPVNTIGSTVALFDFIPGPGGGGIAEIGDVIEFVYTVGTLTCNNSISFQIEVVGTPDVTIEQTSFPCVNTLQESVEFTATFDPTYIYPYTWAWTARTVPGGTLVASQNNGLTFSPSLTADSTYTISIQTFGDSAIGGINECVSPITSIQVDIPEYFDTGTLSATEDLFCGPYPATVNLNDYFSVYPVALPSCGTGFGRWVETTGGGDPLTLPSIGGLNFCGGPTLPFSSTPVNVTINEGEVRTFAYVASFSQWSPPDTVICSKIGQTLTLTGETDVSDDGCNHSIEICYDL